MSINFQDPANAEALRMMQEAFGKPVASDGKTNLFNELPVIDRPTMRQITNAAGQPVTVELCDVGTVKTMDDGTTWRLAPNGWHKI